MPDTRGYYATIDYEKIIHSEDGKLFDFIIYGEGERPFSELIRAMSNGHDFSHVPNLVYRENGEMKINPRGESLTSGGVEAARQGFTLDQKRVSFFRDPADEIETSRGWVFLTVISAASGKCTAKLSENTALSDVVEYFRDARDHGAKSVSLSTITSPRTANGIKNCVRK